jgi:hypothetical protein
VPTPFYHLSVAEELLQRPEWSAAVRRTLQRHRAAFLLGSTAPDVQTVSGQDRRLTHFFDLPIQPDTLPPWERMLVEFPRLAQPMRLPPDRAAFLAGYLIHLQADWQWVLEIFSPVFGPYAGWQTARQRLYIHNVLRAYLDEQIRVELKADLANQLAGAAPLHWLPFVEDVYLCRWRDWLARQLQPGAAVQTVEVFAARQGVAPEEYYRLLGSQERLEREVFGRLPRQVLDEYRQRLVQENLRLIQTYLAEQIDRPLF